jgi:hypothetical protein
MLMLVHFVLTLPLIAALEKQMRAVKEEKLPKSILHSALVAQTNNITAYECVQCHSHVRCDCFVLPDKR